MDVDDPVGNEVKTLRWIRASIEGLRTLVSKFAEDLDTIAVNHSKLIDANDKWDAFIATAAN